MPSPCKVVSQRGRTYVYPHVNYISACVHRLSTLPRGPIVCVKFLRRHIFITRYEHYRLARLALSFIFLSFSAFSVVVPKQVESIKVFRTLLVF